MGEQERGVQVVVNGDVDLAGAAALGVDDESGGGSVALGKIAVKEIEPVLLSGGAGGGGVFEEIADGELGEKAITTKTQ